MYHNIPTYFVRPPHPITINLVGLGGTGSLLLPKLAQIDTALRGIGHAGFFVQAWDADTVSESNIGRQNFFPADIDLNKAQVLISRVNRAFGTNWEAIPEFFPKKAYKSCNMIISCVDTVKARRSIQGTVNKNKLKGKAKIHFSNELAYWMDIGNSRESGQIILGTSCELHQPDGKEYVGKLPTVFDVYPDMERYEDPTEPSCSMAEALLKQDLLINSMMATWAAKLIWDMFRKIRLETSGVYVNLKNYTVNPIFIS